MPPVHASCVHDRDLLVHIAFQVIFSMRTVSSLIVFIYGVPVPVSVIMTCSNSKTGEILQTFLVNNVPHVFAI